MGPIQMFKLLGDYNKAKSIAKENVSMNTKITQYLVLASTVAGLISAYATGWLNGHAGAFTILVGVANVLAHLFPSIFATPAAAAQQKAGLAGVKLPIVMLALLAAAAVPMRAQTTAPAATPAGDLTNIYGVGVSYNPGASPSVAGTAFQAHGIGNTGTYEFTTLDALPNTAKPFTVTTNVGVGVAQKLLTLGTVPIYGTTSTGVAWSGSNAGWQYNFGAAALISVRKDKNYFIMPTARVLKSTINGGYSPILGVEFVFGN
jgi:hypothetical protein